MSSSDPICATRVKRVYITGGTHGNEAMGGGGGGVTAAGSMAVSVLVCGHAVALPAHEKMAGANVEL